MIIFFAPGGRLGNQIFQLSYILQHRRNSEFLVLTNMGTVLELFDPLEQTVNSQSRLVIKFIDKFFHWFLTVFFVRTHLISSHIEIEGEIIIRKGLLSRIIYMEGYFQTNQPDEIFLPPIKQKYLEQATVFLQKNNKRMPPVFCHVRRTDYLEYEVLGKKNPSLPLSFYQDAKNLLERISKEFFWILMGDDPEFVEPLFRGQDYVVSDLGPKADFALMTLCSGGVISNSTFAWWGAYLCQRQIKIAAPLYWLGWKSQEAYPKNISPHFADLLEVNE